MKYMNKMLLIWIFLSAGALFGQNPIVIDKVIAVVGDEIVTKSELERQFTSLVTQGMKVSDQSRCLILEDILYSKTLLNQAKVDSIEITDKQVETEMDRRLRHLIGQFGSEERFVDYYKKPISQIKDEMRSSMREQLLIQRMQGVITSDITVTPKEVEAYFNSIPEDSLPLINAEIEMAQLVINTKTTLASIEDVKKRLREFRERVISGEKFSTIAVLYSEDEGSATQGGEIGFVGRAEVAPEFAAAAFKLKQGAVSQIVKTEFGYHIIQLIERRANKVNVRHILLKPKQDPKSFEVARSRIDSIADLIAADSISFQDAVKKYSEDEETRKNSGLIVDPISASSMIPMDQLDPATFLVIDKLEEGELSEAVEIADPRKKPGYRIVRLNKRTEPHRANLKQDYQKIKLAARAEKEQEMLKEWMDEIIEKTYVTIDEEYSQDCNYRQNWLKNIE